MAACVFLPYMIGTKGYFLFFGDFNVQQIPFYQFAHDAIRGGEWGWSFGTDLGANFIGSYSFYLLGSPFFWLTLPFPSSWVPYFMGPLLILKFACAALTAYLYISRFTKNPLTAQLCALLYAFSGFSVYNIFFNHFHEAIIVFPLLLLAFELRMTENRRGVFALMICICAVTNYFFFYGMMVFGFVYLVIRLISRSIKPTVRGLGGLLLEFVLGVGLAAFLLLPSFVAIADNSRLSSITLGWNSILYGKESIYGNIFEVFFFPPDLPARPVMFPNAEVKWSSLGGWLPVFSMVGVFAYCSARKGSWLKRIIVTSAVMAFVPILNASFSAFNDAYYARWFYMPILMMCLATAFALEESDIDWKKSFWQVSGITLLITLVIGLFPRTVTVEGVGKTVHFGLFTEPGNRIYAMRFCVTCGIALAGLSVLYFLLKNRKKDYKRFLQTAVVCVAVFSIGYANFFVASGKYHAYSNTTMIRDLIEGELTLDGDPDTYRIDVYSGVDNTAMFLGYSSINCFHSIVPSSVTAFHEYVGVERRVASRPEENVYAIRPLLSVKYLLQRAEGKAFEKEDGTTAMPGYRHHFDTDGYKVYENENYIGYGFSYDAYMTEKECEAYSKNDRAKMMLKAILLTDEQIEKYGYMFESLDTYYSGDRYLTLSDETMKVDCAARNTTAADSFATGKNSFSATVERDKETLVFFSIPYDEGWTATVNGVKTDIEKVNVGFMAVPVGQGISEIEFHYTTPGLETGTLISGGSAILFVLYLIVCAAFVKNREIPYPEGDALLAGWEEPPIEEPVDPETEEFSE